MGCELLEIQCLFGKKWTSLVMQELYYNQKLSFNELSKKLKTPTNKMVSERLSRLEKNGLINRRVIQEKPLQVEYSLTEKGHDFMDVFNSFKEWGTKYGITPTNCVKNNCNSCIRGIN